MSRELPETLDSLFSGASDDDVSSYTPDTDKIDTKSDADPTPVVDSPLDTSVEPKTPNPELTQLIRQRDAIIAERRTLSERLRDQERYVRLLEQERERLVKPAEPPVDEVKAPDPKVDPLGYLEFNRKKELREMQEKIESLEQGFTQKTQEFEQRELAKNLVAHIVNEEQNYRQKTPDYDEAVAFLDNSVYRYFTSQGLDEAQAMAGVDEFKRRLFYDAVNLNLSVADVFYQHAVKAGHSKTKVDPRVEAARNGLEAGSSLSNVSRGGSDTRGNGEVITIEKYQELPPYDPLRLQIAMDKNMFRALVEQGSVRVN